MTNSTVKIDIVSDIVCPWCIIGYKRLEKAIESLRGEVKTELHWHPFELNPNMPQGGENLRSHLAAKYGTTLEGSIKARANLTAMGKELGFQFDYFDEMKMYNTFKAHQLLHYSGTKGKSKELHLRLFSAFFGERKAVDDIDVLVSEAVSVGLDEGACRFILETSEFAEIVRQDELLWQARGIRGVPAFVFNDKHMVSGAQEPKLLVEAIRNYANKM